MKANELMVGDFVFHEIYGNTIIENIDNDFGDTPSVKLTSEAIKHKVGYKYGYCWCDLDEIFPIPLTPEILEKNGFVKLGKQYNTWCMRDFNFSLDFIDGIFGYYEQGRPCNPTFVTKYIHELQHALRLCGIEKKIEL